MNPGTRLGPYEVVVLLGAGGMGEVYRARDPKLNRDVAIKVLLPSVAGDPDRLARFSREAQVLASLNHPNIAHIHGLEEAGGVTALVLELVEGEDLAQRIARGPMPVDDALPIARQIAEALEAAHEHGIIHRDLKPANVKVRADGAVKVLDFGLAKAIDPAAGSSATAMNSPTLSIHATEAGIILGTAAYMSPEQARGRVVDRRADIWAFGAVLFEMLTGRRAFEGETLSDTIASVLKSDPPWTALPPDAPAEIRRLLRRCLEKDPKRRLQAIGEARIQLEALLAGEPDDAAAIVKAPVVRERLRTALPWTIAAVAVTGLLATLFVVAPRLRERPADVRPIRFSIARPQLVTWFNGGFGSDVAVSPDGTRVAFVAAGQDSRNRLWVRAFDSSDPQTLPGTENAASPFWSPDSRSVAFLADGRLKRIELTGTATPQALGKLPGVTTGGTWNRDGVILVGSIGGVFRISDAGGDPVPVLPVDAANETSARWPHFLPDGRHFIYVLFSSDKAREGVFVGALDSGETKRIMAGDSNVAYSPPGYLLFARGSTLIAHAIDLDRLELTGEPLPVAENVARGLPIPYGSFSVSDNGVLAYRTAESQDVEQLVWLDRAGRQISTVGSPGEFRVPILSFDGSKIAVDRLDRERGTRDVWSIDVARGFATRLTSHAANDFAPLWSPDGTRVIFASDRDGPDAALYQRAANGSGADELLLGSVGSKRPNDWSHDGKYLLYSSTLGSALWVLPLVGERRPERWSLEGEINRSGRFSPDARWIAYVSNASGESQIYVRSFRGTNQVWRISTNGGFVPEWRADGKELFFLGTDGAMMAAAVKSGAEFEAAPPVSLFDTPVKGRAAGLISLRSLYAVAADGQRFLFAKRVEDANNTPITVVLNWAAALRK